MIEKKDIDLLFNEALEDQLNNKKKLSNLHIKQQKVVENLHNLNEKNIDTIFDLFINDAKDIFSRTGESFSFWKIIKYVGSQKIGISTKKGSFLVECKCGKKAYKTMSELQGKNKNSGGCAKCTSVAFRKSKLILIKKEDLIGKKFGKRTIIGLIDSNFSNVKVQCDCGKIDIIPYSPLLRNENTKCKDCAIDTLYKRFFPDIGEKNGNKIIIDSGPHLLEEDNVHTIIKIECIDCGNIRNVVYADFKRGKNSNCKGCYNEVAHKLPIGTILGNRTVIDNKIIVDKFKRNVISCKCKCGQLDLVPINLILKNKNLSCKQCSRFKKKELL